MEIEYFFFFNFLKLVLKPVFSHSTLSLFILLCYCKLSKEVTLRTACSDHHIGNFFTTFYTSNNACLDLSI